MLRNLNKSAGGRRILGTPFVGLLASQIIAETATGDSGPGLLYDEALVNTGKQLRIRITSLPSAGTLFVRENGDFEFSGASDGAYSAGYAVDADNVEIKTDTASLTVGVINGAASVGSGISTGAGTGGDAVGQAGIPGIAGSGTGTGTGSGSGGNATGAALVNGVDPGGTGTGVGSGFGGSAGDIGDCRIVIEVVRPTRIACAVTDLSVKITRDTIMSSRFVQGEVIRLHALITDAADHPFDPATLALRMRYDNGPETLLAYGGDPEIIRQAQGRFVADIPLAQGGVFHFRWETSGSADGAAEGAVSVLSSRFS